tara:strand:+ start:4781 stop:5959 length:1179 start_codon:yes stop_codon:yes gene_type:complete
MIARRLRAALACVALPLSLSACAAPAQLGRVAVDHNRMVAHSTDETTLLNIVRAVHRFPLHFTALSTVNGNVSLSVSSELSIGLGDVFDPSEAVPAAGVSTNPSFQAAVLASEKFQRGIQAPLKQDLIAYFLEEGWRDAQLMAATVERIDVEDAAGSLIGIIDNDGKAGGPFEQVLCAYNLVRSVPSRPIALASLDRLVSTLAAQEDAASAPDLDAIKGLIALLNTEGVVIDAERNLTYDRPSVSVALVRRANSRCMGVDAPSLAPDAVLVPRFRSTMGVIFFLGEYARLGLGRQEGDRPYGISNCYSDICSAEYLTTRPLISVREGSGRALIATEFAGQRFYISEDEFDPTGPARQTTARSMQAISLVQQLVNLQKSSDELPTAINVRSIN